MDLEIFIGLIVTVVEKKYKYILQTIGVLINECVSHANECLMNMGLNAEDIFVLLLIVIGVMVDVDKPSNLKEVMWMQPEFTNYVFYGQREVRSQ